MSFIAAATIGAGGAVVGGALAADASKDAAKAGADASGRASQQIKQAADQARREVKQYIPAAQKDLLAGYSGAADIFGTSVPEQQRLLSGGNLGAQQTIAGGYDQYRSALMGLPVDQSNWQPKQVAPSAPIENPFKAGMFTDIAEVGPKQQAEFLSGLTNNMEIINAIERGELDVQGIDTGHFRRVAKENPDWSTSKSLFNMMSWTPQRLNEHLAGTKLTNKGKERIKNLVSQLNRLGGVSNG